MIGRETLRIAWGRITASKLRFGLTILGMTIGVASVVVLIAVGNSSSKAVVRGSRASAANVLIVQGGGGCAACRCRHGQQHLAHEGRRAGAAGLEPGARRRPPRRRQRLERHARLRRHELRSSSFVGTTPSYLTAHSYKLAEGDSFTAEDFSHNRRVP